jgi:hypothetical protein
MCDPLDRRLRTMDRISVQERYETDLSVAEDVAWALTHLDKITQFLLDSGIQARKQQQIAPATSEYYAGRADAFFEAERELSRTQSTP